MSIETLNHLLFVAIIFVVVGVLLEGAEHIEEYKKSGWKPIVPKLGFVLLVIGLAGELALHPLMEQADTQIRVESDQKIAGLNQQTENLKAENLKLALNVENERTKRVEDEKAMQAFKTMTQLSEEALSGSRASYRKLLEMAKENSDLTERAQERVKYIQRELAYYEQPPGLVLALELSATVAGEKVRLSQYPTAQLFISFQEEWITHNTRYSLMEDICKKPVAEVNKHSLEMLKNSQYLPVVAATTSILRRLHNKALPFLDIEGWTAYLERN